MLTWPSNRDITLALGRQQRPDIATTGVSTMPNATVRANTPASPDEIESSDEHFACAYRELEGQLRDLVRMSIIARHYINEIEWPSNLPKHFDEVERVQFLFGHVADMAVDLERAYDKVFSPVKEARA
jgi:hypothetical protein